MNEQELALKIKEGWIPVTSFLGLITKTPYSVWRSPDGKWEVGIHDLDGEIIGIKNVETGQIALNPRDIVRFIRLIIKMTGE